MAWDADDRKVARWASWCGLVPLPFSSEICAAIVAKPGHKAPAALGSIVGGLGIAVPVGVFGSQVGVPMAAGVVLGMLSRSVGSYYGAGIGHNLGRKAVE